MLLGVDVGGTFTDAVLVGEDSAVHTAKVPSTPSQQSLAVLDAVRLVLERAGAQPADVERFAHGMTVATNALLEGRTARTALLATEGFRRIAVLVYSTAWSPSPSFPCAVARYKYATAYLGSSRMASSSSLRASKTLERSISGR